MPLAFILSGGNGVGQHQMEASEAHAVIRSDGHEVDERDTIVWLTSFGDPLHVVAAYPITSKQVA